MRTLTNIDIAQVSGGEHHTHTAIMLTPEDFNRENLIALGIFGTAACSAYFAGAYGYLTSGPVAAVGYGFGGAIAGAVAGGAATAAFLAITIPIYNFAVSL